MKHKPIFFCTLCLFTLISPYCFAQFSLSGRVINHQQKIVSEATVILNTAASSAVSETDENGRFIFKNLKEGEYVVAVYALNYSTEKITVSLQKDTTLRIVLNPLQQSLEELTVTGTKPVIEQKADRIIFNVPNSITAAGSNGLELLSKAPGIKVSGDKISLSGQGSLGIMLNGQLLHLSGKALISYLRSFNSTRIDKIEIVTHPSAKYDAEGMSGLINIVTKKSRQEGWSGSVTGSVKRFLYKNQPDYNGIKNYIIGDGGLNLFYNRGKWSLYTQANYSDGHLLLGYGIDVFYDQIHWAMKDTGEYRFPTLNVLAGADYQLNSNTMIGFSYNYIYHMEDGADYVKIPVYNKDGNRDSLIRTFATYYPVAKSNAFNLHLIQKLNKSGAGLSLNADYFNYYRHDKSYLTTKSLLNDGKISNAGISKLYDTTLQNIRIYTFKGDLDIPTPFAQWTFGSKLSFINNYSSIYYFHIEDKEKIYDRSLSNEFRYIENTQALYANGSKKINQWQINAGLRAEITQTKAMSYFDDTNVKDHYLKLFPSLLIAYAPDKNNYLALTFNDRIHRPTFWNMNPYKTFMSAYTYVEGNPYLEPEYVSNIELTHRYKNKLTSSLFTRIINNGFARVIQPLEGGKYLHMTTMRNFIKSYRYGLSESVSLQPLKWFENTSILKGYYTNVKSELPNINGIDGLGAYVETNNTFHLNKDKTLNASLVFWYQFPEIDHFGRSDAYYSVDAGLQWITLKDKLHLAINFNDIFQTSAFGVTTTVNGIKNRYTSFQLNSQLRLSASWFFGKKENNNPSSETSNEAERNRL